jgi:hypothetical protein
VDFTEPRVRALDDAALAWAHKSVWAICIAVYLTVFIGGLQAGGAELISMGRAAAFTVAAAVLGRIVLGLLTEASVVKSNREGPTADQDGPVGSLAEMLSSGTVAHQTDDAEAV